MCPEQWGNRSGPAQNGLASLIVGELTGRESGGRGSHKPLRVGEFYLYHRLYTMFLHL